MGDNITATPAPGWAFLNWEGGIYWKERTLVLPMMMDYDLTARFVEAPSMGDLDLIGDLGFCLSGTGENVETYDLNNNGMPDAAELYLIEYILKNPEVRLQPSCGVTYGQVYNAWTANLSAARTDMNIFDESYGPVFRVVAGYMTLGDIDSTDGITQVIAARLGVGLQGEYDRTLARYLKAKADADNDAAYNIEEWAYASPSNSLADVEAYAGMALDLNVRPEPQINPGECEGETPRCDCFGLRR